MSSSKRCRCRCGQHDFFAAVLTAGLWLLVIPFYPKRCIKCGSSAAGGFTAAPARDGAASAKSSSTSREIWLAVIGGALLMLILAVVGRQTNTPQSSSPAPSNAATEFDRMTPAQHLAEAKRLITGSSSPDQFKVAGEHLKAVLAVDRNNKEASRLQDRAIKLMNAAISRADFVTKLNETNSNEGIHGPAVIDW